MFLHASRQAGTATYISREIATKTRGWSEVNFLLNQPAGNKASSCNLLRASARCRPGNTYCQRLRKHNPSLFTSCSSAGVSMSPHFIGSTRQEIRPLKLSLYTLISHAGASTVFSPIHTVNIPLFCLHALTGDCIL